MAVFSWKCGEAWTWKPSTAALLLSGQAPKVLRYRCRHSGHQQTAQQLRRQHARS
eukprot:SAG25_NODE_2021_length_2018_cov_2.743505_1_plen_55_part_00